jgi:uncharacterized protein (TIGR03089 family)
VVDDGPDVVVCGPDGLAHWGPRAADVPVVACALLPLGVRFPGPVPAGVHDFGVVVWSQPDSFVPWDPAEPTDEALPGTSQAELFAGAGTGDRLLTDANPVRPAGLAAFTQPLVGGGSTVWVRNPDPDRWQRKYDEERATAGSERPGQPARS